MTMSNADMKHRRLWLISTFVAVVVCGLTYLLNKFYLTRSERKAAIRAVYSIDSIGAATDPDTVDRLQGASRTLVALTHIEALTKKDQQVAAMVDTYFDFTGSYQSGLNRDSEAARYASDSTLGENERKNWRELAAKSPAATLGMGKLASDERAHLMKELE